MRLIYFFVVSIAADAHATTVFVAPSASGTPHGVATADGSLQQPFFSLEAARDALRGSRDTVSPKRVLLMRGHHVLSRTFRLDGRDSGTPDAPTTYTNYDGPATVSGGVHIPKEAFQPVALPSKAPGAVMVDLFKFGLNASSLGGLGHPYPNGKLELFYGGRPMTLARDPNIAHDKLRTWMWAGYENTTAVANTSFTFADVEAATRWRMAMKAEPGQLWLHGYWKYDWRDTFVQVQSIEPTGNGSSSFTITRNASTPPQYQWVEGCRFYAVNALGLLDDAGEYYVSPDGKLYFLPPDGMLTADVEVSVLETIISSHGAHHTSFENISISTAKGAVMTADNAIGLVVRNCTVSNGGSTCISLNGMNSSVQQSSVFGCGGPGIAISGGNWLTLAHGNLSVVGNDIAEFSRIRRTYTPGVSFSGVGLYVANNSISDGPHCAIQGGGNDNLFEYNTITHASFECTDTGAFYIGRSWSQRGNVARYNVFDTVRPTERLAQKSCSQNAFYLDDQMSGWEFYGNVIKNSTTGILLGGGRDNHIYDNVFIDNDLDIAFDNRGMSWMSSYCKEKCSGPECFHTILVGLHYTKPPYSTHYPELVNVYQDFPCVPVHNTIANNTWCHRSSKNGGKFINQDQKTIESWRSSMSGNHEVCDQASMSQAVFV